MRCCQNNSDKATASHPWGLHGISLACPLTILHQMPAPTNTKALKCVMPQVELENPLILICEKKISG
jgi:hypothetical protein